MITTVVDDIGVFDGLDVFFVLFVFLMFLFFCMFLMFWDVVCGFWCPCNVLGLVATVLGLMSSVICWA